LRVSRGIPAFQPPQPSTVSDDEQDVTVVTIAEAERVLDVTKATLYRWLRDGFITGEQLTPGAPWRIRIDQRLRDRIQPDVPDGWLSLDAAAKVLGVARQIITPEARGGGSFADPVTPDPDAGLLDRLIAFTGRTTTQ